jgi:CheY-like chemotaxis protein
LVVDDDEMLRETLCEVLTDAGYETASAVDGVEALRYLRDGGAPCVILLDLMMPNMDGWQFRIRQQKDPLLSKIPTAVMTASYSVTTAQIHADYFLRKPIKLDEVLRVVAECASSRRKGA